MKIVKPVTVNLSNPYPPWQFRSKKALQYEIGSDNKIKLVEVRPTMVSKSSLLGWSYKFSAVIIGDETAIKEVDISLLCLFEHGPIVVYEKTVYDIDLKHSRTLVRGKRDWWELDENERIGRFHLFGNREKGIIERIEFRIIDKNDSKPDRLHTTTKKFPSVEF